MSITTIAVLIGVVGGAYWYGGRSAVESTLVLNTAPAASDGIKVHGDWTVTVSNPDGSVDSVHEFKNSLNSKGTGLLTSILAGENDGRGVRDWDIGFKLYKASLSCAEDKNFFLANGYHREDRAQVTREVSVGNPLLISKNCTLVEWVDPPKEESPEIITAKLINVYTEFRNTGINYGYKDDNDHFTWWQLPGNVLSSSRANLMAKFTEHPLYGDEQIDVEEGQYISFQVRIAFE
jgi:hypothetical protein